MALVEIVEGNYYVGLWFVDVPASAASGTVLDPENGQTVPYRGQDWLFTLWRKDDEPTQWHLAYRVRYIVDGAVFESADVKHSYRGDFSGDEIAARASVQTVVNTLVAVAGPGAHYEFSFVGGGPEAFQKLLEHNPPSWMHFRIEKEEADNGNTSQGA